jgi:hypothetical protein
MLCRKVRQSVLVEVDCRRLAGVGQALSRARETKRAVTTRLRALLAEIGDERLHLAAVVCDEREDAGDALGLGLLAPLEPRGQRIAYFGE